MGTGEWGGGMELGGREGAGVGILSGLGGGGGEGGGVAGKVKKCIDFKLGMVCVYYNCNAMYRLP